MNSCNELLLCAYHRLHYFFDEYSLKGNVVVQCSLNRLSPMIAKSMAVVAARSVRPKLWQRSFFASSTDHTQLLATADIHELPSPDGDDNQMYQLVLAAQGMDLQTVIKVPQLHLARISVQGDTLHSAKVVNRTLGSHVHVCSRLVKEALQRDSSIKQARSTLHGLSDWILEHSTAWKQNDVLSRMAKGDSYTNEEYQQHQALWEDLAIQFSNQQIERQEGEVALYASNGASLASIQHNADTSEFRNTCAGAMALFAF